MKRTLRREMRTVLRSMDPELRHDKSLAACRRLIASPEWKRSETVFVYLSAELEPDTTALLDAAWRDGKDVCAPRSSDEHGLMTPTLIRSWTECLPGERGILEPIEDRPVSRERIDLVVVPGLAFDGQGARLSRGRGHFDRFLTRPGLRAIRCGFAFAEQLLERLPPDARDEPVHALVTDDAHLRF